DAQPLAGLRDGELSARGLPLHAGRRRGAGIRQREPHHVPGRHRGPAHADHLQLRPLAAVLRHRQRPPGCPVRQVGRGALREQPHRRERPPGAGPGAWPARPRGLPDQPAEDVRRQRARELLAVTRRLLQRAGVAGALAVLGATAHLTPSRAAGAGYPDLCALCQEWRAFQRPRVRDGVPDYTPAAMAAQQRGLPAFQRRLQSIDRSGWPVAQQVDWEIVRAEMNGLDFDLRVLRPWARDPAFYAFVLPEQSDTPTKEGPAYAGMIETWKLQFPLAPADL